MQLDKCIIKHIHTILTENIIVGGIYRNQEVRISGADHTSPAGNDIFIQPKNFFADSQYKDDLNPFESSAWTHEEFVRIDPFIEGNRRTPRLIMNYQLMINGFFPISMAKENRLEYYNALEEYAVNNDLLPFSEMICKLENEQLDIYLKLIK